MTSFCDVKKMRAKTTKFPTESGEIITSRHYFASPISAPGLVPLLGRKAGKKCSPWAGGLGKGRRAIVEGGERGLREKNHKTWYNCALNVDIKCNSWAIFVLVTNQKQTRGVMVSSVLIFFDPNTPYKLRFLTQTIKSADFNLNASMNPLDRRKKKMKEGPQLQYNKEMGGLGRWQK